MEIFLATSYAQLQKQIQALQAEAAKLKQREAGDVIARIKEAIAHYGLTAKDLFDGNAKSAARPTTRARRGARAAKYSDGQGNVWGGRGPRPMWLRDAIASGKKLEDFAIGAAGPASGAEHAPKPKASRRKKGSVARYQDGAGNTWSGRGRKPKWFTDALASGKTADEMLAK